MNFNLIDDAWIPVLYANGRFERVGIRKTLTEAGSIRQIAASNPMDNVALLRFLLAVLQWCKPQLTNEEAGQIESAPGVPESWLGNLNENRDAFNLLGNGVRFFQDKLIPRNARPIGDLLVEFPTETKIAHFRHVRDKEYGLCPACCALGIVRFCAFANYAGKGYTSGVNGPAPAYAIAQGATLLDTLWLHWPANAASSRKPPWLCAGSPSKNDLDLVTVFAWRSRRIWLGDPDGSGDCAYCGQGSALIRELAFTGGWTPPFETSGQEKKFWNQDPHLILVNKGGDIEANGDTHEGGGEESPVQRPTGKGALKKTTLSFPRPGSRAKTHAGFWRRVLGALPSQNSAAKTMLVAGPAASQTGMLYQDSASLCLRVPSEGAAAQALETQEKAIRAVSGVLRRSTLNPDRQHPNRTAGFDALSPSLEANLRRDLDRPSNVKLEERLASVVERIVRSTTYGSPLRRREALERAQSNLDAALHKAATPPSEGSPPQSAAKPKRARKKKGDAS